jgi:hypothetical protein
VEQNFAARAVMGCVYRIQHQCKSGIPLVGGAMARARGVSRHARARRAPQPCQRPGASCCAYGRTATAKAAMPTT